MVTEGSVPVPWLQQRCEQCGASVVKSHKLRMTGGQVFTGQTMISICFLFVTNASKQELVGAAGTPATDLTASRCFSMHTQERMSDIKTRQGNSKA